MFTQFSLETKSVLEAELSLAVNGLDCPNPLKEAMLYSLEAGGKRIRPLLLFAVMDSFGVDWHVGLPAAVSLEMIHTYSLIHDDLPSMDDDDLRRGKPTNHKVFGEAYAILAGDALLTYAFEHVSKMEIASDVKVRLVIELAKAAGPEGMVAGQVLDMEGTGKNLTVEQLEAIHRKKTGRLLAFAAVAGAILSSATDEQIEKLRTFATYIGLAFQIRDDILDVEGDVATMGKLTKSDEENEKSTYVSLYSLEEAKEILSDIVKRSKDLLAEIPIERAYLEALCDMIANREK